MGVGVYSDDFNKTGGTFLVDGLLEGDQDDYDDFNLRMIEVVEQAGRDLDLGVARRKHFDADRASFDSEFVSILEGRYHEVGWRAWEHDFVIGVGAMQRNDWQDKLRDPEAFTQDVIVDTGRSPQALARLAESFSDNLLTYVRLNLQSEGFECRYRTSGYTTSAYETPANIDAELAKLRDVLIAQDKELHKDPIEAFKAQDKQERVETIEAYTESLNDQEREWLARSMYVNVPIYNHLENHVMWYNPATQEFTGSSAAFEEASGVDLRAIMADEPQEAGLSAIPRDERTEAWFQYRAERGSPVRHDLMILVASADEYAAGSKMDFEIEYDVAGAEVERLLDRGDNLLAGANVHVASLAAECTQMLEGLQGLNSVQANAFRGGLEAVRKLATGGVSSEERQQLVQAIQDAHDAPEGDGTFITFAKYKRPDLRPG